MSRPDDAALPAGLGAASVPAGAGAAPVGARAGSVATARTRTTRAADTAADAAPPDAPRFAGAWAALTYAVATLLLGFPALAGRFLVNPMSDQYIAGYAFREFATQSVRAGEGVPLWNPFLFGGMPYVAAMHGDTFYPTALLRVLLGTDTGMTWGLILHVFLAGCFTYLFLRGALGLSFFGALVGGLAYMIGGNVAGLVSPGHDGKLFIAALLPLVLFITHRGVRDGRAWAWGALAVSVTLAILTPHPQLLQYLLLVTGAYALFVAFSATPDGTVLPRGVALRRLGLAAVAVALGVLGSAIQYWPVLEYTAWSPRAGGKGWEHAISYSMPPEELLNTYLPQFTGVLDNYWGRNGIHFHSEYVGAAVFVLAGLAFGAGAGTKRQVRFWGGVLVVAVLWALGGYTPFYHLVYALVPGTKYFRAPSTMLYVVSFAAAILAAVGTERALALRARPRYLLAWIGLAAMVAVLATSGMLTSLAAGLAADPRLGPVVDQNGPALTLGAWRSFVAVAAIAGLLLAVTRRALRPALAGWLLAGVVALDLWSVLRLYWRFSPPASELYAADPVVNYLRAQSDSGRVYTLPIQQPEAPHDPFLTGDALMAHRIRQVTGYHGNELGRYQQLYGKGSQEELVQRLGNPNFWRLTNLRFFLTNVPDFPIEGAVRVAGPVRNAAGSMEYLYRVPGDNPPAWVTPLAVKAPDENVLPTVLDPRFDLRTAAIFDTATAVPTQVVPQQLPGPLDLTARIIRRTAGSITVGLSGPAPANATLVVSENYYPGWTATVNGRPAPVGRANLSLIGVGLPAGAREVQLAFTSPRYERGRAITLGAVGLSVLLALAGLAWERRARA